MGQQHDLFLIDGYPVGIFEVFLHIGEVVGDGFAAVFAGDEVGDIVQGPRAVEGVHGDEVLERSGGQFFEVLLHPRAFILEDTDRFAALKELVGFFVFEGYLVGVEFDVLVFHDHPHGVFDDGEGFEAQEVHFEEPGGLCHAVVELGDEHVRLLVYLDGHVARDFVGGDDDTAGVDTGVAHRAFEAAGGLDHFSDFGIAVGQAAELVGLFEFVAVEVVFDFGVHIAVG